MAEPKLLPLWMPLISMGRITLSRKLCNITIKLDIGKLRETKGIDYLRMSLTSVTEGDVVRTNCDRGSSMHDLT